MSMMSEDQRISAFQELGKAFKLCSEGVEVQMFSMGIDSVWHQMIDQKPLEYREFCNSSCGAKIEHTPITGEGEISFIAEYERCYGQLPKIWFTDERGEFLSELYGEYIKTNMIIASWNCSPAVEKMTVLDEEKHPNKGEVTTPPKDEESKNDDKPEDK